MGKTEFSFMGFAYNYFGWIGRPIAKLFSNGRSSLEDILESAGIRVYPPAYYSFLGFLFILGFIVVIPIVILTGIIPLMVAPLLVPVFGYFVPMLKASDRAQKLDTEVPFAAAYISIMATGGLAPYESLKKLKGCDLLPNISRAVRDIEVDVQVKGLDPVTAIEKSAENLPSNEYKDLMLGYASTLRTGGDVLHYLLLRTETMFRDLAIKVRANADRAATLMETYIAVSILITMSLTIIFMTTMAFGEYFTGAFTTENFLMYSYILFPVMSVLFIYLADMAHMQEPVTEWGPYKVFGAMTPVLSFLLLVFFVPYLLPGFMLPFGEPFINMLVSLRTLLGLERGYEAAFGLAISLIVCSVPVAIAHRHYAKRGKGLEPEITSFLRDMTETRKTGASPEKCLEMLSKRFYGNFSKYLIVASRQIQWGLPIKTVYNTLRSKIKAWMPLINIYLLVDAIEVGGGSPETLETLARFSEMFATIKKEKDAMLRPLLIMPYVGAGILLFSSIIFLGFMRTISYSFGTQTVAFVQFANLLLPPLILQVYFTGLVTGKINTGTLSNGFKHATFLVVISILIIVLFAYFPMGSLW
ncbi:MAG: type II secretion system F family protein [Candidatus Methanomethylicia archaeon]|nr:type II secretion system F family protein [Candidatus Methanomethylicia archaeon]